MIQLKSRIHKCIFIFCFNATFLAVSNGQLFEKLTIPEILSSSYFIDLKVVNENVVWVLVTSANHNPQTTYPFVLLTKDGGKTWTKRTIPPAANRVSYDVYAFDELTAIITSNRLVSSDTRPIFKTVDGGVSWKTLTPPNKSGGGNIHFFDNQNGMAFNSGYVSLTEDGGDTWIQKPDLDFKPTEYFTFWNGSHNKYFSIGEWFWIGSDAGRIFRTKDMGNNWEIFQAAKTNESIDKLIFTDTLNGYALVTGTSLNLFNKSILYKTNDGGATWKNMEEPDFNFHYIGINPFDNKIYLANEFVPSIFRSNNQLINNEHWETCIEELVTIYGLEFFNNVGYAIGRDENDKNIILKIDNNTNAVTGTLDHVVAEIFPNPATDHITLLLESKISEDLMVVIHDMQGRLMERHMIKDVDHFKKEINTASFNNGIYQISIFNNKGLRSMKFEKY